MLLMPRLPAWSNAYKLLRTCRYSYFKGSKSGPDVNQSATYIEIAVLQKTILQGYRRYALSSIRSFFRSVPPTAWLIFIFILLHRLVGWLYRARRESARSTSRICVACFVHTGWVTQFAYPGRSMQCIGQKI